MRVRRGDFFLSLSLNDFVLTILFLLLLLSLWSLTEGARELRAATTELSALRESCDVNRVAELEESFAVIRELLEKAGRKPEEVERLVLVALKDAQRIQELEREKSEFAKKQNSLQATIDALKRRLTEKLPADSQELARRTVELEGQLAFCTDKMEKQGFGKVPCWLDARNRVSEYIYTVTIHERNKVSVEPRWPSGRVSDVAGIDGAEAVPGIEMTLDEFKRRAMPVRQWSDRRDCGLYVYVRSETESTFTALNVVEKFFHWYTEDALVAASSANSDEPR